MNPVRHRLSILLLVTVLALAFAAGADVPPRKVELIRQAMTAMKLDQKIQGMIDAKIAARVQKIRIENPEVNDSVAGAIRETVALVYSENREGRDGLDRRVLEVFDRHLSEADLRFVANFNGSDNGKRYREVAPRIVSECLQAGQFWSERLEPELRRRLESSFREWSLKRM
jgi:hypothetical protein